MEYRYAHLQGHRIFPWEERNKQVHYRVFEYPNDYREQQRTDKVERKMNESNSLGIGVRAHRRKQRRNARSDVRA